MSTASFRLLATTVKPKVGSVMFRGRRHLTCPAVLLIGDGVYEGLHSDGPEFVSSKLLAAAPQGMNGRPILPWHPTGSANLPDIIDSSAFGVAFNAEFSNGALQADLYIDAEAAVAVGTDAMSSVADIVLGRIVELSVGCYIAIERRAGTSPRKVLKNSLNPGSIH